MSILLNVASKKDVKIPDKKNSSEAKIHALNILRTLFRDATLSEAVMPFVSCGFIAAIEGFKSHDWGVRNSSNLLFSALMTRMFGVNRSHDETRKKNKLSGKTFVSFYKDLYNYLYHELKEIAHSFYEKGSITKTKISIQPSLYPVLLILGRLYQANGMKDEQLSSFIPYLQTCACSPIWKTRDMAAKALVSIIPQEKVITFLQLNLEALPKHESDIFLQNSIHGQLLQILYLLKEFSFVSDIQKEHVKNHLQLWLNSSTDMFLRFNHCLSTRIVFLEIYMFSMSLDIKLDIDVLRKFVSFLWNDLKLNCSSVIDPNLDSYLVIATVVLFLETLRMNDEELSVIYKLNQKYPQNIALIVRDFFQLTNNKMVSAVFEILFWLLKDDGEDNSYLDTSEDFIEFQRVSNILKLLNKRTFNFYDLLNHSEVQEEVKKFWNQWEVPHFIKQIYNLSVVKPSLVKIWIKFKDLDELDNKLKCLVYKIESSTSDEETRALILFSAHIFMALCQEFKLKITHITMVDYESLPESYEKWLKVVEEIANPDNSISHRHAALSVLQLLHAKSLFPKSELLDSKSCYLWQALFLLLTDDEPEIKQKASEFVVNISLTDNKYGSVSSVVPSKALEQMLTLFIEDYRINFPDRIYNGILCNLSHEKFLCHSASLKGCICIPLFDEINHVSVMLNWMLTSKAVSVDCMNDEQPFDKGEMNVFSEDLTLTDIVSVYLVKYLEYHKEEQKIFPAVISCWKDKFHSVMTFKDAISTCFEEASSIIDSLFMEANIPVIADTYFDLGLVQINQRLIVLNSLLPSHLESESEKENYLQTIRQPAKVLYERIGLLPFKTFFVESIMRQLEITMK